MIKIKRGFKQFILRLIVFIALSYIVLPLAMNFTASIFNTSLRIHLNYLYNSIFISSIILIFLIYNRKKLQSLESYNQSTKETIVFGVASIALFALYFYISYMINFEILYNEVFNIALSYIIYFLAIIPLVLAVFNLKFAKKFQFSLLSSAIIITLFFELITFLRANWFIFAKTLSSAALAILYMFSSNSFLAFDSGSPVLSFLGFAVSIGAPCSGIDSLALFTSLFLLILAFDWNILDKKRALVAYVIGVLGMFLIAILRIVLLMLIGSKNPALSLGLFHANAGWILFVVYFFVFFWIAYPIIKKKK